MDSSLALGVRPRLNALRISVDRPLCAVNVFAVYTVANRQALLQKQAESAAVAQRLYMDRKPDPSVPSAAKHWQNLKYWVKRFGDSRLNPNSLTYFLNLTAPKPSIDRPYYRGRPKALR